jgi:DICT domain-containing protein
LIVISRYIERHAWQAGEGTLRTSFQRLSRIDDERGTREMYETLAGTDIRTHVYGIPD